MEQGRSSKDVKIKTQVRKTLMRSNVKALFEVRLVHSSDETFVMRVERRGSQLNILVNCQQELYSWKNEPLEN